MPKRPDKLVVENPLNDQDFGGKDMAAALRTLSPGKTTSMVRRTIFLICCHAVIIPMDRATSLVAAHKRTCPP